LVKDLPPALQSPYNVHEARDAVDLALARPFVLSPKVKTFQLEVCVCPHDGVDIQHHMPFDLSLNTIRITQRDPSAPLLYHFCEFIPEGGNTPGLMLIPDHSPSPDFQLGQHARVVWSVDTQLVSHRTSAVVLAVSSRLLTQMRKVVLTLFETSTDAHTGQVQRLQRLSKTDIIEPLRKCRVDAGSLVLAVLAQAGAWWHLHVPVQYAEQASAEEFSQRSCRAPQVRLAGAHGRERAGRGTMHACGARHVARRWKERNP
jgi:hypothetical protein